MSASTSAPASGAPRRRRASSDPTVIGWREIVGLPELGLQDLPAKIDTGARTSALHATRIREVTENGETWVEFDPPRHAGQRPPRCRLPLHDRRAVKNTSGVPEVRYIVRTPFVIAGRRWLIELSLTNRADMSFPIIVGRAAIRRHRLLVDSGRSYLTGRPQRKTRSAHPKEGESA